MKIFKSLFGKLFTVYMGIILGSFILLAAILSQAFESYFIHQKKEIMLEQGEKITKEYAKAYYTGIMDLDQLKFEMQVLDKYLNSMIWIVDHNGRIYVVSRNENQSWLGQKLTYEQINDVFEGKIVTIQGKFGGYFKEPVLTIGYPIQINGKTYGALFMHTPIPEIQKTVGELYKITLICLGLSIILAFFFIYFLSKQITKPMKEMNEVAKVIAGGDFQRRLEVVGKDEVAELANSFNYMAEELNKLEELRKGFIANISHDLRSPLTSIKGFVQAILDGTIPKEKQEKYLKIVLDETRRLTKMTNDIMDLTKMESGQMEIKKDKFEINNLIRTVIEQFEQRILQKKITLKLILAQKETIVFADREQIQRVIYNLLDNAVKFVPEEGKIWIETTLASNKIFVSIKNTGENIPKEDIAYIWDRFHKGDKSRGKDKTGMGLGLSIVKQILKNHGEIIKVENDKDGVIFTFSISIL
ncbi:sensor histidine kinase [Defluviitalea phaphyphila]|uniref:sensor histidine kinase n=1 Tax=Defluviitalea phaphyphila TaxID=1473580 RepID=UPI000731815D|nr:HAMP domain-containing sensor histidine kinase [Defluviitalea phaphyphila]